MEQLRGRVRAASLESDGLRKLKVDKELNRELDIVTPISNEPLEGKAG